MAESIVGSLMNWLSPRSAEAKVTPTDAQAREYVEAMRAGAVSEPDPYRAALYQAILQKAEAERRNVNVGMGALPPAVEGQYAPQFWNRHITLSERAPAHERDIGMDPKYTLGHELLHFLADRQGFSMWPQTQHRMIDYVLGPQEVHSVPEGGQRAGMGPPMAGAVPNAGTRAFTDELLRGTPLQHEAIRSLLQARLDPYGADWLRGSGSQE